MADRDDCNFLSIRYALRCLNEKVSIFAVVMEVGLPRKSRGTDWYRTMKIIDESLPQSGMAVNFFEQSVELLPHVLALGDIIVLCNVRMTHHNGEVFAVFNKKSSSFGLYRGKDGDSNDIFPYQVSLRFLPRHLDLKFIAGLRNWLMNFQVDEGSSSSLLLRDIKEGREVDLVFKILHVYEASENEWIALVWDGTDAAPISINPKVSKQKGKGIFPKVHVD